MTTSVIIPTYNGAHKLPTLLDSLLQQTYRDFELIVVVDGSTDNTIEVLSNYKDKFPDFKIIQQSNQGRAVVRNNGAKAATGSLLIFFDDDMRPTPVCVEKHVTHQHNYPNSILVGAQVDDYKKAQTDIQRFKVFISNRWTHPFKVKNYFKLDRQNIYLTAANFSICTTQFQILEGFDDRLTDAEDFDFAMRAKKVNIAIYYWHEAFAWHDDFITCDSYIRRTRQYRAAHKKLLEIKSELYGQLPNFGNYQPRGIKKVIFQLIRGKAWIQLIDRQEQVLKLLLPKKLRYKFYDLVITANSIINN